MRFESDKKARGEILSALALFSNIGVTIAITILLTLFLGKWLDDKFGTSPLFILISICLGVGGAGSAMFKMCARFYNAGNLKGGNKNAYVKWEEDETKKE